MQKKAAAPWSSPTTSNNLFNCERPIEKHHVKRNKRKTHRPKKPNVACQNRLVPSLWEDSCTCAMIVPAAKSKILTVDGRNPAPPKKPWNDGSPVNPNKPWFQPWFESGANYDGRLNEPTFPQAPQPWPVCGLKRVLVALFFSHCFW